jgi:hypothetical protein
MDDIVLDRGVSVMKLDDTEQALMDEIEISAPEPRIPKRVVKFAPAPPKRSVAFAEPDLGAFINPSKQVPPARPPPDAEIDYGDEEQFMDQDMPDDGGGGGYAEPDDGPSEGYTSIEDEKADLLNKLARLGKKGFAVNKRLNAYSSIQELRTEYRRIMYTIEVEQSVKFSRRMLVACVSGLEFLNKRYNPFEVHLDGWSETVMENLDDYDSVFEELYNKYKTKVNMAPEVKLIMMLGGSAMMFHLTNSMFKAAMPNMNDVMKQNPDLVKSMVEAVQNTKKDPTTAPVKSRVDENGRREMQGPGFDITSLMGGIMMPPPPPMNSTAKLTPVPESDDDSISDIVSISGDSTGGEVKDVRIKPTTKKASKAKKNEISI